MIEMLQDHHEKEVISIESVAVIGAAGQVGEALINEFASHGIPNVYGMAKEPHLVPLRAKYSTTLFSSSIEGIISNEPELIILATPNPSDEILVQTAFQIAVRGYKKAPTILLLQNGVDVVPKALKAIGSLNINIIRGSLFSPFTRDETGDLSYNRNKIKLSLAQVKGQNVRSVEGFFHAAGFKTEVCINYQEMEWTKLFLNAIGTTGTITGLTLAETFADERLFRLEVRAIRDRLKIMHAAGFPVRNFVNLGIPAGFIDLGFSHIPEPILQKTRQVIGNIIGRERNNIPSSTSRRISQGKITEAEFYHSPFIALGAKHDLANPIDQAILSLVEKHEGGNINLNSLSKRRRIELLQREITRLAPNLQIDPDPRGEAVRNFVSNLFFSQSEFLVLGTENLDALGDGHAILAFAYHTGHMDSLAVRRSLPVNLRAKLIIPAAADYWFAGNMSVLSILKALTTSKGRISLGRTLINPLFCKSIPIVRDINNIKGMKDSVNELVDRLNRGYFVAIAPEGTRNRELITQRTFEEGIVLLAAKTGLPIIPIVLHGLEDVMPRGKLFPRLKGKRVVCQIGKPMNIDMGAAKLQRASIFRDFSTTLLRNEFMRLYGALVHEYGYTSIAPQGTIFPRSDSVN